MQAKVCLKCDNGKIIAKTLILLLLVSGGYGIWWYFNRQAGPEAAVRTFANAVKTNDMAKAKFCLSRDSINIINKFGGEKALFQIVKRFAGGASGKIIKTTYEENTAVVKVEPSDKSQFPGGMKSTEIVLVQENKEWKIDAALTIARVISKSFRGVFEGGSGKLKGKFSLSSKGG